jgi:prepilin-type N-terminal cleavage/methylation domain-containing protein
MRTRIITRRAQASRKQKQFRGFTLIELLVVVSIFLVLTTATVLSVRRHLFDEGLRMVTGELHARLTSMRAETQSRAWNQNSIIGLGMRIEVGADEISEFFEELPCDSPECEENPPPPEDGGFGTYNIEIPPQVTIEKIDPPRSSIDISFTFPRGEMQLSDNLPEATITFVDEQQRRRHVRVNRISGRVDEGELDTEL